MFCNTCILFFDLSFFGLSPEVESDQALQPLALLCSPNFGSEGQRMDACWVEMEVQSWHLHYRILCEMAIDQAFEGGAWLGGKKGQT